MTNSIEELNQLGQSVWFDYIRRRMIESGELEQMIRQGIIYGVTSNPTIFRAAIAGSNDYDAAIDVIAARGGASAYEAFLEVGGDDIRAVADLLRPVYDRTGAADGYVSFEAQEGPTPEIIAEAKRMFTLVDRPNLMIKVPGTTEGIAAVAPLISGGININITLLFDVDVYAEVSEAYIQGLEQRLGDGQPLETIASVASFFVSRVDTKVDALLPEDSPLRGKVAIANAWLAYSRFQESLSGPRWKKLAAAGAHPQRPLWGSTGTKNAAYSDILYVEGLMAPQTVNTLPEATLKAFLDHGTPGSMAKTGMSEAEGTLRQAGDAGVDLQAVTDGLLVEGLASFGKDFASLLEEIGQRLGSSKAPDRGSK